MSSSDATATSTMADNAGAEAAEAGGGNNGMTTMGYLRAAREWATPTLKKSAFLERGVLTPEEFVLAGDELVFRCPTWSWESGAENKRKSYLPSDKQYLVTRNVPCQARVSSLERALDFERICNDDNDNDNDGEDWLVSTMIKDDEDKNVEDDFDILDQDGEVVVPEVAESPPAANGEEEEEEEEYADMDDFEDENILVEEDEAAVVAATTAATNGDATSGAAGGDKKSTDNLLKKVRTYDLSITYDKYYQTPRVWMVGKAGTDDGRFLTGKEMMQDVISDYANKTVTMEGHPHLYGPHASIHPCQHGNVMKAIVRNLIKQQHKQQEQSPEQSGGNKEERVQDGGPTVEMYLFIFLKFVSSMIPTINYDFTMDVTADTRK